MTKQEVTAQLLTAEGYQNYRIRHIVLEQEEYEPQEFYGGRWHSIVKTGAVRKEAVNRGRASYHSSQVSYQKVAQAVTYCLKQIEKQARWS